MKPWLMSLFGSDGAKGLLPRAGARLPHLSLLPKSGGDEPTSFANIFHYILLMVRRNPCKIEFFIFIFFYELSG
jgi:hypothetical protein